MLWWTLGVTKESCWLNPETRCLDSDYLYNLHCFHCSTTTATASSASSTVFWLALTSTYGPLWTQEQKHPFCFNTVFIFSADISVTHLSHLSLFCSFHFTYMSFLKDPWTHRTALLKHVGVSPPHIYAIFSWWLTFLGFLTVLTWSHCFCSTQCLPTCYTAYLCTVIIAHFFHLECKFHFILSFNYFFRQAQISFFLTIFLLMNL